MATATYTPIASQTLTSSASSVTFSSIPADYRDLVLVCSVRSTGASGALKIGFNGSTSSYSQVAMLGDGSATASYTTSDTGIISDTIALSGDSAGTFATVLTNIMDYSATDKHKSVLLRNSTAARLAYATAGRWATTSAVTSVEVIISANQFAAGSTFSLYGVAA